MEDKEILRKVIERAIKNGYKLNQGLLNQEYDNLEIMCRYYEDGYFLADTMDGCETYPYSIKDIIFSHEFAQAFFGEETCEELCPCNLEYYPKKHVYRYDVLYENNTRRTQETLKNWEYHLQQMVLEPEPLKYLEKFLKGEQLGK